MHMHSLRFTPVSAFFNEKLRLAIPGFFSSPTAPLAPMSLPFLLSLLPVRFRWALHNLIAHPLSEVIYQFGLEDLGNTIHDITIPLHEPGTGRG